MKTDLKKFLQITAFMVIVVSMFVIVSCSGDDKGTQSNPPDDGNQPVGTSPPIPRPSAPDTDPGEFSETWTKISAEPMKTYNPVIEKVLRDWYMEYNIGWINYYIYANAMQITDSAWCNGKVVVNNEEYWSDSPMLRQGVRVDGCTNHINKVDFTYLNFINPYPGRELLVDSSIIQTGLEASNTYIERDWLEPTCGSIYNSGTCATKRYGTRSFRPLQSKPYLRRDQYWRSKTLESGRKYDVIVGQVNIQYEMSYSFGSSVTESEEFGRSVTAEVGIDLGLISGSISGTLSESFTESVTHSFDTTRGFNYGAVCQQGQTVQFSVWELVEEYSFTDKDGNAFTDPNYVFKDVVLTVKGRKMRYVAKTWEYEID